MIDTLRSGTFDPVAYSFNHQAAVERHAKNDISKPTSTFQRILRARYELALCEIGEPPIPNGDILRVLRAAHDYKRLIVESSCMRGDDWATRIGPPPTEH